MAENSEETAGTHKNDREGDLPQADSPPLSPGGEAAEASPVPQPALPPTGLLALESEAAPLHRRFDLQPHQKRNALLVGSVAIAAALGVVAGLAAGGAFTTPPRKTVASLTERHAIRRSIGKLDKEIAALKASIAAAEDSAHSRIAKTAERLPEITGSIPVLPRAIPMPKPRPAMAASHAAVVRDWTIRFVRDGYVYVGQEHGDIYRAQLGAPLPGVGPVQEIKRESGRWLVVTPKGLIIARSDRRYFE
jgi:hypothetical protein